MNKKTKIWTHTMTPKESAEPSQEEFIEVPEDETELRSTCDSCDIVNSCEYAYDPYCTGGDCLWIK